MDHTELIFDFLEGGKPLMDGWYDDYFKKMRMPWEEAVKTGPLLCSGDASSSQEPPAPDRTVAEMKQRND